MAMKQDGGDYTTEPIHFHDALEALKKISLSPPPSHSAQEFSDLLQRVGEFAQHQHQIEHQNGETWIVDLFSLNTSKDPQKYYFTRQLQWQVYEEAFGWIMQFKRNFNRPRPYQVWPNPFYAHAPFFPGHPSYPSGHSSDAHIALEVFRRILQGTPNAHWIGKLEAEAWEIAINRERAGVHFPSDSVAGKELAEKLVAAFETSARFIQVLSLARAEWETT